MSKYMSFEEKIKNIIKSELRKCFKNKLYLYRKYGTDRKKYPSWLKD